MVKKSKLVEVRTKIDTLEQVLLLLRRCRSLEEAQERIVAWLSELEEVYRSLLVEDPVFSQVYELRISSCSS